jgi:hypothetical protein
MSYANPIWLDAQRQRFVRHDAHRITKPEEVRRKSYSERVLEQQHVEEEAAEQDAFREELQHLRWLVKDLKLDLAIRRLRLKYRPDQPRDERGRWVDDARKEGPDPPPTATDFSDARRPPPFARPKGHHFVARAIYKNRPLSPEAKKVFDDATTGPLRAQRHGWSDSHDRYNQAVGDALDRFMKSKGVGPEQLTADQAREFVDQVKRSTEPRIRDLNLKIFRREMLFWMRFGPRRGE